MKTKDDQVVKAGDTVFVPLTDASGAERVEAFTVEEDASFGGGVVRDGNRCIAVKETYRSFHEAEGEMLARRVNRRGTK